MINAKINDQSTNCSQHSLLFSLCCCICGHIWINRKTQWFGPQLCLQGHQTNFSTPGGNYAPAWTSSSWKFYTWPIMTEQSVPCVSFMLLTGQSSAAVTFRATKMTAYIQVDGRKHHMVNLITPGMKDLYRHVFGGLLYSIAFTSFCL